MMNRVRKIGNLELISIQELSDQLGLEAGSVSSIFVRTLNAPPYYRDPGENTQHLRYVEMRIADGMRAAVSAAVAAGLPRPRLPEEHRPRGRNDGRFMTFVRKHLIATNYWTPEQLSLRLKPERRGKNTQVIFNPPLPWPEISSETTKSETNVSQPNTSDLATTIADLVVEKLIAHGFILQRQ